MGLACRQYSGWRQLVWFFSFYLFGVSFCFFTHVTSDRTLGAELKIMPESKQLPSLGTRLKLAWFVGVSRD